jgi:hypothetical protein
MKTLHAFAGRVGVVAGTLLGVVGYPTHLYGDTRENRARMDLSSIEKALLTFQIKHGHYPHSLEELTQRHPDDSSALLKSHALRDPWNQPYHYDPGQLHPETGIPLVWTDGDPGKPTCKIANWGEQGVTEPSFWHSLRNQAIWISILVTVVIGLAYGRSAYFKEATIGSWQSRGVQVGIEIAIVVLGVVLLAGCILVFAWQGDLD